MMPSRRLAFLLLTVAAAATTATAGDAFRQPYPEPPLSADEIARQVYYGIHAMHVKQAVTKKNGGKMTVLVNSVPGRRPAVSTLESYLSSDFDDGVTESKHIAIFRSGSLRGTGILMVTHKDAGTPPGILMWLPTMRKVRRIMAPNPADKWMGSALTYGDVFLRKPGDETHELLGVEKFAGCLGVLVVPEEDQTRHTRDLPGAACGHEGKAVYKTRSSTKFEDWWYDYRVSWVDTTSFAVYRTVYYKGDAVVKTIEADWRPLDKPDPRIVYPNYIYAKAMDNGVQSMLYVPYTSIETDPGLPASFWTEKTLRKIKR